MMDWGNGWSTGDWIAMSLMMTLFWGAVIGVVVWAVVSLRPDRPGGLGRADLTVQSADQLLEERFARGEISADEFAASRELLHNKPGDVHGTR